MVGIGLYKITKNSRNICEKTLNIYQHLAEITYLQVKPNQLFKYIYYNNVLLYLYSYYNHSKRYYNHAGFILYPIERFYVNQAKSRGDQLFIIRLIRVFRG
jgi:hypothetical protein